VLSRKPERMDEVDQVASIEPGYSNNMKNLSVKKKRKSCRANIDNKISQEAYKGAGSR
jgi:hypothetical protein